MTRTTKGRKAWAPTCTKCGVSHHGLVTCEQAKAAGDEAIWVDEAPPSAEAAAREAMKAATRAAGAAAVRFAFTPPTDTAAKLQQQRADKAMAVHREAVRRVVPTYPPQSRAFAYWSGPTGAMGAFLRVLAFGDRPDLGREGDITLCRLRIELRRNPDRLSYVGSAVRPRWWNLYRIRVSSDFWEIERRLQYRAVARYMVSRLVGPTPTKWDFWREEGRLEGVAWSSDDATIALGALKAVRAIRGVAAEHGFPDRHGREWRGFFDVP